jgi:16S rRNA (guanine527-N7)-methyltransferase
MSSSPPSEDPVLGALLARSRELGFLGPGDPMFHVEHGRGFAELLGDAGTVLDLGSGGGVPGLVIAAVSAERRLLLVDGMQKRCRFLDTAASELAPDGRVGVACGRAEDLAHDVQRRGRFDAVTSRSFGPPAVTAECAAAFLRVGGLLVVSEPPVDDDTSSRWDGDGLAELGLSDEGRRVRRGFGFRILRQVAPCPERYPRRSGVPSKRPLFGPPRSRRGVPRGTDQASGA